MQSDWKRNCPRAVLPILRRGVSVRERERRREGTTPPQEAPPFCLETGDQKVNLKISRSTFLCAGLRGPLWAVVG